MSEKNQARKRAAKRAEANASSKYTAKKNLQASKRMMDKSGVSPGFANEVFLLNKMMKSMEEFAANKIAVFIKKDFQSWKYYHMSEIHKDFGAYPVEEVLFARIIYFDYWIKNSGFTDLPDGYFEDTLLDHKVIADLMPKDIVCFYILKDGIKGLQAMNLIFAEPIEKRKQVFENNLINEYINLL